MAAGTLFVAPLTQPLKPAGTTIPFTINVTAMASFDGWDVLVKVDPNVLNPQSISLAGNLLGTVNEFINCVNGGAGIPYNSPGNIGCNVSHGDLPGTIHSAATSFTPSASGVSGLLFAMTFVSLGGTYSVVDPSANIISSAGMLVPRLTARGEYGTPPGKPPTADFTWTPNPAFIGLAITFNASASHDDPLNNPSGITSYEWDFGDGSLGVTTSSPTLSHFFRSGFTNLVGNFTVTLSVTNKLGAVSDPTRHTVPVTKQPLHDLWVASVAASTPEFQPGTMVSVSVVVANNGTFVESGFNLAITVGRTVLGVHNYTQSLSPNGGIPYSVQWDTTGLTPGTYQIVAYVEPLRNATSGQIIENNTRNNLGVETVRVYSAVQGSFLPFSLGQTVGLAAGILVGLGVLTSLISRLGFRRKDSSLDQL